MELDQKYYLIAVGFAFTFLGVVLNNWGFLLPYVASKLKQHNSEITMSTTSTILLFFQIGNLAGNFIITSLLSILGSKYSFYFSILLSSIGNFIFVTAEGFWLLALGALFVGINDQFMALLLAVTAEAHFHSESSSFLAIAYTGYAMSPLIWPFAMCWLINPNNLRPSEVFIERGVEVKYFGTEVVANLQNFLVFQWVVTVVVLVTMVWFMKPIVGMECSLKSFLLSLFTGKSLMLEERRKQRKEMVKKRIRENVSSSIRKSNKFSIKTLQKQMSRIRQSGINSDLEISLIPSEKPSEIKDSRYDVESIKSIASSAFELRLENQLKYEEVWKELMTMNFLLIFCEGVIRFTTTRFFRADFKVWALQFFSNDNLISLISSLSHIAFILQGLTFGKTFKWLGIYRSYSVMYISFIVIHVLMLFFMDSLLMFTIFSIVHRFFQGFNTMMSIETIFGRYGNEKGLLMFKYFDASNVISVLLSLIIIWVFGVHFTIISLFFVIINVGGLYLLNYVDLSPLPEDRKPSKLLKELPTIKN